MTISQYVKDISYNRETRDYAMRLDGELVGFARTYRDAETTLDQIVYDLLSAQPIVAPGNICQSCGGVSLAPLCPDCEASGYMVMPEGDVLDIDGMRVAPKLPITDTCPSCGDPLPSGARLCAACLDDEPAQIDLTTQMYQLLCPMLSGTAGAATVLTLARGTGGAI